MPASMQIGSPSEIAPNIIARGNWRETSIREAIDRVQNLVEYGYPEMRELRQVKQFLSRLVPLLRSKPDDLKRLATVLNLAVTGPENAGIVAVLASPTAVREAPYFVQCANLLRECLHIVHFDVVLARWEYVIERDRQSDSVRTAEFRSAVSATREFLTAHGWSPDRLHPIDVLVSHDHEPVIAGPCRFACAHDTVWCALYHMTDRIPDDLIDDLKWTIDFYGRQATLKRLGPRQPLIDLAIRREIGRALSAGTLWTGQQLPEHRICITSELTPRLVKCYRLQTANLNISVCAQQTDFHESLARDTETAC